MEDRDFFDCLYQGWSKTTGAENKYWMPEKDENEHLQWLVLAVDQEQQKRVVGQFHSEADAAFITAVHGCFADLCRRLHSALDEADRWEHERDSQECRIAELVLENQELVKGLACANGTLEEWGLL